MIKALLLISVMVFTMCGFGQTRTSILSGNWTTGLIWSPTFTTPNSSTNAVISIFSSVVVTSAGSCSNLTVIGEIKLNAGGSLNVANDLEVDNGTIDINNGYITVNGDFILDGTLEISEGSNNYIEVKGKVGTPDRMFMEVRDGSIKFFSNIKLEDSEIE